MDVLHVTHQFAPETRGGLESYVQDVARQQRQVGRDVHVLSGSMQPRPQVMVEDGEHGGIPLHRLHRDDLFFDHHAKAWHPGVSQCFGELLRRWRPAVVHVHQWLRLSSDLVQVASAAGVPAVLTLHDFYTSCPRAFRARPDDAACRRPLSVASCIDCVPRYGHESREELAEGIELFADSYRAELAHAAQVLVAVGATADLLAASTGVPRQRYRILPLGYRRRFGGRTAAAPEPGRPFRFAYWGSIGRHKGVAVLVEAFGRLIRQGLAAELHVLGDWADAALEAELRQRAAGLPVTFHGPFQPADLLTVAPHAGIFPSTCIETFGIVLDECFELGLPAVVTDHGALAARAGGAALRAGAGDVTGLAAAMARLATDRDTWHAARAAIPPLPPDLSEHVRLLDEVYAEARTIAASPESGAPIPLARRLAFLQRQRESALGRITPEHGPR